MSKPNSPIQSLPKSINEALILSSLVQAPRHGYQIVLDIESRSAGAFTMKHGTLYPILHRLEQEGLIVGTWSDEGPKAKRKSYRLTKKGKTYANAKTAELEATLGSLIAALGLTPNNVEGDGHE